MHLILFPLLIIIIILGFYYVGDIWRGVNPSVPFLEDGQIQLPGSPREQEPDSTPESSSPFDTLR